MSLLFTVENKIVRPYTETLLISPFKEIWDRDKRKDKTNAIEDFTYIEFVTSQKKSNPYKGYEEELRKIKVKEEIITRKDWKVDKLIEQGLEKIIIFQKEASFSYSYYTSAKKAAEKIKDFFDTFDMKKKNTKSGNPLYKPKEITNAINDTLTTLQNLNTMKEKVEQELFESTKTKGQKEISPFANPD